MNLYRVVGSERGRREMPELMYAQTGSRATIGAGRSALHS